MRLRATFMHTPTTKPLQNSHKTYDVVFSKL